MKHYLVFIRDGDGRYPTIWEADNIGHAKEQAEEHLRWIAGEVDHIRKATEADLKKFNV